MKTQITIALAVAAWLVGATVASAALFSTPAPQPSDSLSLSSQEQQAAWNDLSKVPASSAPATFKPSTSSAIPSTLQVGQIPAKTAQDVPALQPYDFAKTQNKLLIVNPHDMMIAAVIAR
jgi:hypothetical protein